MLPREDKINPRQFAAIGFMSILSPMVRGIPAETAEEAGAASWLSVILAAAPLAVAVYFLCLLAGNRRGMAAAMMQALGSFCGRLLLALYALWFLFLAAFILRTGADRFIGTIYPGSGPQVFVIVMLIACLPAAMGSLKALGRASMIFRPVLLIVLALVFGFALPKANLTGLWQISGEDEIGILRGSLSVAGPMCMCLYLAFACDQTTERVKPAPLFLWLGIALFIALLLCVTTIGTFGAEMAGQLRNPFFAMVRDMSFFGSIERIDAVIVAIWVFSDFVLISMLLFFAVKSLHYIFSIQPEEGRARAMALICAAISLIAALLMAKDAIALDGITQTIVPPLTLLFAFVLPPLVLLVGRLRGKL